jgi:hypothetical protein
MISGGQISHQNPLITSHHGANRTKKNITDGAEAYTATTELIKPQGTRREQDHLRTENRT